MVTEVFIDGSYRLHLDFLLEMMVKSIEADFEFEEKENSICLTIVDKKGKPLFTRDTSFLDKRRAIEAFMCDIIKIAICK